MMLSTCPGVWKPALSWFLGCLTRLQCRKYAGIEPSQDVIDSTVQLTSLGEAIRRVDENAPLRQQVSDYVRVK